MEMNKRNKKYNGTAKLIAQTDDIIKYTGIYQLPMMKCEFVSFGNHRFHPKALSHVYCNQEHRWTVALLVFKINARGLKVVSVEYASPPSKCTNDAIAKSVEEKHNLMIAKCDHKEFVCAGWLAIPRYEEIDNKIIMDMFDKLGVWDDYITDNGYKLIKDRI